MNFPWQGGSEKIDVPSYIPQGGLANLELYLSNFMLIFIFFGICLMLIYVVWGGMQWARSGGEKQQLEAAKSRVKWAIIGLIILLLSYAFVNAVGYLFKVNNLLKLT
jgi:hypothetical protein